MSGRKKRTGQAAAAALPLYESEDHAIERKRGRQRKAEIKEGGEEAEGQGEREREGERRLSFLFRSGKCYQSTYLCGKSSVETISKREYRCGDNCANIGKEERRGKIVRFVVVFSLRVKIFLFVDFSARF